MPGPSGPVCQSCGMPMSKDALGGGTEADGAKTQKYCSHCYRDGKFTNPDLTVEQMRELVRGKLKEMGFPGFVAKWLTKGTPKLERWKGM